MSAVFRIQALTFGSFLSSAWQCCWLLPLLTTVVAAVTSDLWSWHFLSIAIVIIKLKVILPQTKFATSYLDFISEISQHLTDIQGVHCMGSQNTETLARSKLAPARNLEDLVTLLWNKGRGKADYKFREDRGYLGRSWHTIKWRISLDDPRAH